MEINNNLKLFGLFFLIALIIVFVSFYFNLFKFYEKETLTSDDLGIVNNQENRNILPPNYYELAIQSMDVNLCEKIDESMMKQNCRDFINLNLSKSNLNLNNCNLLTNEMIKNDCINFVSYNLALNNLDKSYCNSLNEMDKNNCIEKISLALAYKNLDVNLCNDLNIMAKDICIKNISLTLAKNNLDMSYCNVLSNFEKDSCINEIILEKSVSTLDIDVCNQIKEENQKNMCIRNFINNLNETNNDKKYCEYLSEIEILGCIRNIIMKEVLIKNDITLCNSLEFEMDKNSCININALNLSLENLDISYCSYLNEIDKMPCISRTILAKAKFLNQSSVCDEILVDIDKQMCLSYFRNSNETIN